MAALKTRLEALETLASAGSDICAVELMTHDDPRAGECLFDDDTKTVTRIVLVPLSRPDAITKEAPHGYA